MNRPILFPSPRGQIFVNQDFVMTVTEMQNDPHLAPRSHPERHCNITLVTGMTVLLPYPADEVMKILFDLDYPYLPVFHHCCEYHDPDGGDETAPVQGGA